MALLLGGSRAEAYCRTTTADPPSGGMTCPGPCVEDGFPLAWPAPRIEYVFNEKGFPGIDDASLRAIFRGVFDRWQTVPCDGQPNGLNLVAAAGTTSLTVGPMGSEPNANVISHMSAAEWEATGNDKQAFALTAIWYDVASGSILGADMYFNGGMDPFGVCPESGCVNRSPATDLPNVAVHEAGHFLGLAHSEVRDSTMWCDAEQTETGKRSLSTDDERGICEVYPPGIAFTDTRDRQGGCSCRVGPERDANLAGIVAFSLLALGLLLRRRPIG